jgi:hypothetical protein
MQTRALKNSSEIPDFFTLELYKAPQPPSFFPRWCKANANKSSFSQLLKSISQQSDLPENVLVVI